MKSFFRLENPVWRFVGNIADMFLLSLLWYLCSLPAITSGAATTAMYYVTLKLTSNQEGYTFSSYLKSFRLNWKPAVLIWSGFLIIWFLLGIDFYWCFASGSKNSLFLIPIFFGIFIITQFVLATVFPLLARCKKNGKDLLRIALFMSINNLLPILSTIIVTYGIFLFGIFVFWPLLLIAPGLSAYINSYTFNRLIHKYHLDLPR